MRLNRSVGVASALLLAAAGLAGCSGSSSASSGGSAATAASFGACPLVGAAGRYPFTPVTPGVLTAKAILPNPGLWDGSTPDTINGGFEYCIAANIAHAAGLSTLKVENVVPETLTSGQANQYDVAMGSVFIKPKRALVVDFSDPYYDSESGVLVKSDSTLTQAGLKGALIGVTSNSGQQQWVNDVLKPTQAPRVFDTNQDLFAAVLAGLVDVALNDTELTLVAESKSNGKLKVLAQIPVGGEVGVVMPKGTPNKTTVDKVVADLTAAGTLKQLQETYLAPVLGRAPAELPNWTY